MRRIQLYQLYNSVEVFKIVLFAVLIVNSRPVKLNSNAGLICQYDISWVGLSNIISMFMLIKPMNGEKGSAEAYFLLLIFMLLLLIFPQLRSG